MVDLWIHDIESLEAVAQDEGTKLLCLRMAAMSKAGTLAPFIAHLHSDDELDEGTKAEAATRGHGVDRQVQPPGLTLHLGEGPLQVLAPGEIACKGDGLATQLRHLGSHPLDIGGGAGHQAHQGPLAGEVGGDGPAEVPDPDAKDADPLPDWLRALAHSWVSLSH